MSLTVVLRKRGLTKETHYWQLRRAFLVSKHKKDLALLDVIDHMYWSMSPAQRISFMNSKVVRNWIAVWCPEKNLFETTLPCISLPDMYDRGFYQKLVNGDYDSESLEKELADIEECIKEEAHDDTVNWIRCLRSALKETPDAEVIIKESTYA